MSIQSTESGFPGKPTDYSEIVNSGRAGDMITLTQNEVDNKLILTLDDLANRVLVPSDIIQQIGVICNDDMYLNYNKHIERLLEKYDTDLNVQTEMLSPLAIILMSDMIDFSLEARERFFVLSGTSYQDATLLLVNGGMPVHGNLVTYLMQLDEMYPDEFTAEHGRVMLGLTETNSFTTFSGGLSFVNYLETRIAIKEPSKGRPSYVFTFDLDYEQIERVPPMISVSDSKWDMARKIRLRYPYLSTDKNIQLLADNLPDNKDDILAYVTEYNLHRPAIYDRVIHDDNSTIAFGPVNPYSVIHDDILAQEYENGTLDINVVYGGPRMLHDLSIELDEGGLPAYSWFTGFCRQCSTRIERREYAVRKPYVKGGWLGCYCSWECIMDDLEAEMKDTTNEETDKITEIQIMATMTRRYESLINTVRIHAPSDDIEEKVEKDELEAVSEVAPVYRAPIVEDIDSDDEAFSDEGEEDFSDDGEEISGVVGYGDD